MKRFCRIFAVILAVLMLVTMTTACKQSDEDEWDVLKTDSSFEEDETGDPGEEESDETDDPSGSVDDPADDSEDPTDDPEDPDTPSDPTDDPKEEMPEAPATQEEVIEQYKPEYKYEVQLNPLFAETKAQNYGIEPSFNIDSTGFVKNNVKLADLKGKTFTLITSVQYGVWDYVSEKGEAKTEFDWYDGLKDTYGINVKYIVSRYTESIAQALTYMNSGKALDCIPTHAGGFPQFLNLSQPLDPYVNIQNLGNSPGVDLMTLEETHYGGGYRCISPIGAVDVLWYNKSIVEEFGLADPHTLWKEDKWDWNAWRNFITSAPTITSSGKPLAAYSMESCSTWVFALTNGVNPIAINTESSDRALINNWMDERVLQAMDFYTDAHKSVQAADEVGNSTASIFTDGTCLMGGIQKLMFDKNYYDYASTHKFDWVPYPKSPHEGGQYVAVNFGYTMMLPRKMKSTANAPYAVKFMELWATRFTEALCDYFTSQKAHNFTYEQKKEYFGFAIKNTYFPIEMGQWRYLDGANQEAMRSTETGMYAALIKDNINYRTWHTKVANIVEQAIKESMDYAT